MTSVSVTSSSSFCDARPEGGEMFAITKSRSIVGRDPPGNVMSEMVSVSPTSIFDTVRHQLLGDVARGHAKLHLLAHDGQDAALS